LSINTFTMITRIKLNGFKSLLNTELYFGPFTCIAGANAIGKSNFFDAIVFLSNLADNTILHAAKSIRSENQRHSNIKDIFFRSGNCYLETIRFEIDMIVPRYAEDDLGQMAEASITSLRYTLELKLNDDATEKEPIEIVNEELRPITLTETRKKIFFEKSKDWVDSVVLGRRASTPFISTDGEKIKLHSDSKDKRGGRTTEFIAKKMPRTLLSTVTAESPTAFLARHEMRSWMMLQFEPSALRQPNSIFEVKNATITALGHNLPATLYRLHNEHNDKDIYQLLTNRLKDLVDNVDEIMVDNDEKRDLLTLHIRLKDGLILPAQSLSDGTLRFLGLASIEVDTDKNSVICLEEPENGISPKKIEEMINLLEDMATDTSGIVDKDNPFRQVIINSHSPLVVRNVSDDSLYLATEKETYLEAFKMKVKFTAFSALEDTWKTRNKLSDATSKGEMISYLENDSFEIENSHSNEPEYMYGKVEIKKRKRTVAENVRQFNLFSKE